MNIFEKKGLELLRERCHKYDFFYENINYDEHRDDNEAQRILWWQEQLGKNGLAEDYYYFVYSLLIKDKLDILNIGYEFLYGMSDRLRQDKDFEEILVKLSGNAEITEYISKRKLTYLEAAAEYYHSACIGTHECKKFDNNCWECILSHYNPNELYDSFATRFQDAVNYSEELFFGSNNVNVSDREKSLVKIKVNRKNNYKSN